MGETATKTVADRVNDIITEAGFKPTEFSFEAFSGDIFAVDGSIDSLDVAEVVIELECEFDLEISDEDMLKIKIVQDMIDYIEGKMAS